MVLIVRLLSHDLHCASPPFPGAIASSTFYSSDAADAPTERVITLAPGAYEIAVSGTNFRTGPASFRLLDLGTARSEEHTSELQSLMRISYAVFCLKKKKNTNNKTRKRPHIHHTQKEII